jgi:5'-phosphate synthase pdxT subunit
MGREIRRRVLRPGKNDRLSVYGTCAGAILLGKRATGKNAPSPLGLIDIDVQRNAYGEQLDSFQADLKVTGIPRPLEVSFIRAPKITRVGRRVQVLASHDGVPVLVRQGNVLAGTFHPEVRGETKIHELFVNM